MHSSDWWEALKVPLQQAVVSEQKPVRRTVGPRIIKLIEGKFSLILYLAQINDYPKVYAVKLFPNDFGYTWALVNKSMFEFGQGMDMELYKCECGNFGLAHTVDRGGIHWCPTCWMKKRKEGVYL